MQKITEQDIKLICEYLVLTHPKKNYVFYRLGLARIILEIIVGKEWTNQVLFPNNHPTKSKASLAAIVFLRTKEIGFQFQERVCRLANRLYDVQHINGLEKTIEAMKKGDIALGYAEIEASSFFYRRDIDHEFVLPTGVKRSDFDIKLSFNNQEINCEVKHKVEGTEPTKETLEKALSNAKEQVPEEESALFFIKIPEEWVKNSDTAGIVERVKGTFFSRSKNVLGFLLHWEERHPDNEGMFMWKFKYEENPHCEFKNDELTKRINSTVDLEDTFTKLMNKFIKG